MKDEKWDCLREGVSMKKKLFAMSACCLLLTAQAVAGEKIKIEIVEATTTIQTLNSGQIHFMFDAKATLPDGSHATMLCLAGDNGCAGIEPMAAEKSSRDCSGDRIMTCTTRNLGLYPAKRDGNVLTIYGPRGKLKYRINGSW